MIRRPIVIGLLACAFAAPLPARAAGSPEAAPEIWKDEPPAPARLPAARAPMRTRLFWQVDFWSKGSAYRDDEQAVEDFMDNVLANGYDAAQGTIRVTGGLGFRFGVLFPYHGIELGPSLGYALGPAEKIIVDAQSTVFGDARVTERNETSFTRFMAEAVKQVPAGRRVDLRLRGALGVAFGRIASKDNYAGSFVTAGGLPATLESSNHWAGLTWELMPSLLIKRGGINYELGVGFAGFPTMKEQDRFSRFKWEPVGIRLGVEFK